MFSRKGFSGAAAGTLSIAKLITKPITESPISTYPAYTSCALKCSPIQAPATVPRMIARNVPNSITPFPHDKLFSGRSSGSKPYFDGPKSAA